MAIFVHLTPDSNLPRIKRNGITPAKWGKDAQPSRGVFAFPVTADFYVSHQWLRELARRPGGKISAVYFRIDDAETVYVGRFQRPHEALRAVEAVALIMKDKLLGYQVIVPRRILSKEIMRTKALPQTVGWRYFPEAKGKPPTIAPLKGSYGAAKTQQRLLDKQQAEDARYFSRFPKEWYTLGD